MPTRMKFRERRIERQEFAAKSAEEREKRGDSGQLAHLESAGHGHCREADKLRKKLSQEPTPEVPTSDAPLRD